MPHTPEELKRVQTRVRRIRGQAEALERALEQGTGCAQVLQQIAAIRGAVNGLMSEERRRPRAGEAARGGALPGGAGGCPGDGREGA